MRRWGRRLAFVAAAVDIIGGVVLATAADSEALGAAAVVVGLLGVVVMVLVRPTEVPTGHAVTLTVEPRQPEADGAALGMPVVHNGAAEAITTEELARFAPGWTRRSTPVWLSAGPSFTPSSKPPSAFPGALGTVADTLMADPEPADVEALRAVRLLLERQLDRLDVLLLTVSADRLRDEEG